MASKVRAGNLVVIKGPVQYYDDSTEEIVTDQSMVNKEALVSKTEAIGEMSLVKLVDGTKVFVHPKNLKVNVKSDDLKWMSVGGLVTITGPVCRQHAGNHYWGWPNQTKSPNDGGWMNPPSRTCTNDYKDKIAQIIGVRDQYEGWYVHHHGTKGDKYLELKITGKRGGIYYAVAWPSAVAPAFTV